MNWKKIVFEIHPVGQVYYINKQICQEEEGSSSRVKINWEQRTS